MDDNHFQRMFLTTTYRQQHYLNFVFKALSAAFPDLQRSLENCINLKGQAHPVLSPEKEKAIKSLKDIQSSSIESRRNIQLDEVNCSKIGILGNEESTEESIERFTDLVKRALNETGLGSMFDEIPCTDPTEMNTKLVSIFAEFFQIIEIVRGEPDGSAITLKNNLALLAEEVSPLLSCIIYGDKKIVKALIERVKRIENGKHIISNKIFLAACLNGSVEVARLLLEFMGEDILYQKWNCRNLVGLNALHIASLLHHNEMTAFLLDNKFPVNTIDGIGRTPLTLVVSSFHKDMSKSERQKGFDTLETLFNNGANTFIPNLFGASAFHCACELINDRDVFKHFLNGNVNDLMGDATSPLMLASQKGNTNIVRLLLQQNASVNHHNEAGHAPIHYACISGVIETVTCLLDYGAKPDDVDNLGMSPLMFAAANGHIDVVKVIYAV
ncbi:ankyrin repeat domain-containing protein 50-like [Saccostrea cucullata]|uniref:ankyrin repeat domain-containing protein 50-like n=1 Tax=Saccostrea cuccullata TaxID=36930 RepID=UPI002ED0A096